ncbi:AMP-binding protein [Alteromonas halophila]|uniref:Long-chain-fatty-acid--CoA ligase n=1 Tax=Alteromonas halophila TaxID=516698 RepID=A0A918MYZ5_9ALTE|nr:AMP-binding protein [Alteromonas halophila]GGW85004.1 AMP-ligase [Alteromonas halophila]
MAHHPLVTREPDAPFAYLTRSLTSAGLSEGQLDTRTFLIHVNAVASALDKGQHAINLCGNRYLFLVSFCAAIVRGHTNLLPPNKNIPTQQQLACDYDNCYILHDGSTALDDTLNHIDVSAITPDWQQTCPNVPQIADEHLACISFTSGSTGRSKPNLKYWRTLHVSTGINYRHMLPPMDDTVYTLATMPAQHMWGLETSALLPLFHDLCMTDAQPLFPQDILDTLAALPNPTLLVSTPVHLRALTAEPQHTKALFAVLCATSPLGKELAQHIETQFACPLHEVYGCSEVGSMAVRRTAKEDQWLRFDNIDFTQQDDNTVASADHLPQSITLQDKIVLHGKQHFSLAGRTSDLIKIAGKRGSLFEINQVLQRFDGLQDGIIVMPESDADTKGTTRLCAIVALKENSDKAALTAFLRQHLDSAFVPRPVYVVDALPRESNGKLLKAKVGELLSTLKKRDTN